MKLSPLVTDAPREIPDLLAEVRAQARPREDHPFVCVNMISTADGRAAHDGRTVALGEVADLELLLELRVIADAVLVGTGTLRAEGYDRLVSGAERRKRRVAAGLKDDPLAVVLTRRGDVPWNAGLFQAAEQEIVVYSGVEQDPPDVPAQLQLVKLDDPTPAAALADLRGRGIGLLLCEGGPTLFGALLAERLVDELFLTISPQLTGDEGEPTIVSGGRLPEIAGLTLRWVLREGDELFLRYGL